MGPSRHLVVPKRACQAVDGHLTGKLPVGRSFGPVAGPPSPLFGPERFERVPLIGTYGSHAGLRPPSP